MNYYTSYGVDVNLLIIKVYHTFPNVSFPSLLESAWQDVLYDAVILLYQSCCSLD